MTVIAEITIPRYFSGGQPTSAERAWDDAFAQLTRLLESNGLLANDEHQALLDELEDCSGFRVWEMSQLSIERMWAWKAGQEA
jgi:hypothetical protein